MSYETKGPLEPPRRHLVPAMPLVDGEADAVEELGRQFSSVAAYGMLLLDDAKHPMSELVRERWPAIHNLTGDSLLLFSFERPAEWTDTYVRYWRNKLGGKFDSTWKQWQSAVDPGSAYTYLGLFKPPLRPDQLPCLVLFTDIEVREAVVRPIPNWDKESLFTLLKGIVGVVQDSAQIPKDERLAWLAKELTSPGARFLADAKRAGTMARDYFMQHPAQVVTTALSVVLGLSGAGLFALPPVATEVLKFIKDTMSGTKQAAR